MSRRGMFSTIRMLFTKGTSLVSMKSDDVDKDEKFLRRMFYRRKMDIGIYKERDRGLLWFKNKSK